MRESGGNQAGRFLAFLVQRPCELYTIATYTLPLCTMHDCMIKRFLSSEYFCLQGLVQEVINELVLMWRIIIKNMVTISKADPNRLPTTALPTQAPDCVQILLPNYHIKGVTVNIPISIFLGSNSKKQYHICSYE